MLRIDAHQHFWRYQKDQYPWMTDAMGVLRQDHLPEDLEPLLKSLGFEGSIAVQARQTLQETEWLLDLADRHAIVRGVVGWLDLRSPEIAVQLERFSGRPKLVGVRHVVQDEPDDRFLLSPEFRRGISQLPHFGLTYDLLVFPRQLPAAVELAREFPEQRFVLDHIGKPAIREGGIDSWREDLETLAAERNVWCKLSGLVTEADWKSWRPEDFHEYLEFVMGAFGSGRVMIGSDWPVCRLAGEYGSVMRIVIEYLERFPAEVRDRVLGENCAAFYRV